jgi:hypothetical protein
VRESAAGTFEKSAPSENRHHGNNGKGEEAQAGCCIGEHIFTEAGPCLFLRRRIGGAARAATGKNTLHLKLGCGGRRSAAIGTATKGTSRLVPCRLRDEAPFEEMRS